MKFLKFLKLYENEKQKEEEIIAKLEELELTPEELEQAYNMAINDDITEGIKDKIAKAAGLIGVLASLSHAGAADLNSLEHSLWGSEISKPTTSIDQTTQMAQKKSVEAEKIASKLAYLMHPQLVKGDQSKYGHVFTVDTPDGVQEYSLDLGISDSNKEIVQKYGQMMSGILDLAIAKAMSSDNNLIQQMKTLGVSPTKLGTSAARHFLSSN
jgi:hypothetical protein